MRVIVPLPFDVSSMANGRNLRVVHLVRAMARRCRVVVVPADERIARGARSHWPHVELVPVRRDSRDGPAGMAATSSTHEAGCDQDLQRESRRAQAGPRGLKSRMVRRAIGFFGCDKDLSAAVRGIAEAQDVVLGFGLPTVGVLLAATEAERRPRVVCDLIDDPWLTWKAQSRRSRWRVSGMKAAVGIRLIRRDVLPRFDALVAVGPEDARTLRQATGREVAVVPNGVCIDNTAAYMGATKPLVVLTGGMSFPPNIAAARFFAQRVWPRLSAACNEQGIPASLAIVGAEPVASVRRLARLEGVTVTGRVEDVGAWLRRARVAVAPMVSGSGLKNKVLEACAAGCPVIASPLGALGLPTGPEHGVLVASTIEQWVTQAARLLAWSDEATAIGVAGRAMVRRRFSWDTCAAGLLAELGVEPREVDDDAPRASRAVMSAAARNAPRRRDEEVLIHAAS